ncbi:MBL fold metallo-hydrolase [Marivirga sp.]|uniref:MBL fold metallo-hydrolase n=1 Tax=Marivirga sp. TaxID=2018662 RepID=UPI0025D3A59B|nr:MBL fold metallo-hydrolase [Marivirga sp.]
MTAVKFNLASAGYCEAKRSHALSKASNQTIKFYATYAHIEHPIHGHILFDTGYTRRFYEFTKKYPFKIYARVTKVYVNEEDEAKNVLKTKGIYPNDIKFIIISHFHADHIGGLRDFPNAEFICSDVAFQDVRGRKGFFALKKGFIPSLMPEEFQSRTKFLSFDTSTKEVDGLGPVIDLFNDESILICQLDGHAKGQIGALLNADKKILLISDAAWLKENYADLHLPNPIVRLFFDSWSDFKKSLHKVHTYHKTHPETLIIPCHCEETINELIYRK